MNWLLKLFRKEPKVLVFRGTSAERYIELSALKDIEKYRKVSA